jgi:hypothetical protein
MKPPHSDRVWGLALLTVGLVGIPLGVAVAAAHGPATWVFVSAGLSILLGLRRFVWPNDSQSGSQSVKTILVATLVVAALTLALVITALRDADNGNLGGVAFDLVGVGAGVLLCGMGIRRLRGQ